MLPSLAGLVSALLAASSVHGSPLASRDNNGHHLEPRFINLTIASVCQSLNSQTSVYGIRKLFMAGKYYSASMRASEAENID